MFEAAEVGASVSKQDYGIAHTRTDGAPWQRVRANDERFARIAVMRAFCGALKRRLG